MSHRLPPDEQKVVWLSHHGDPTPAFIRAEASGMSLLHSE
jgi:hypothetical protein